MIRSWFTSRRSAHETEGPSDEKSEKATLRVVFVLKYKENTIGTLEYAHERWIFSYSEWFKSQDKLQPFANFPDKFRSYETKSLPPFFESRLPGMSQPHVEAFLHQQKNLHTVEDRKVAMLKKFGRRSITNPFELVPAF